MRYVDQGGAGMRAIDTLNRKYSAGSPESFQPKKIVIIGAGVAGLLTGLFAQRAGHETVVISQETDYKKMTSGVAAAILFPYKGGDPVVSTRRTQDSVLLYQGLKDEFGVQSGIIYGNALELRAHATPQDPEWASAELQFRRATHKELPAGYQDGWWTRPPVIDTDIFMPFLTELYKNMGGVIKQGTIKNVNEVFAQAQIVVAAPGGGARDIEGLPDVARSVYPVRGQILVIRNYAEQQHSVYDEEGKHPLTMGELSYVVRRVYNSVIGGTFEQNVYNPDVNESQIGPMLARAKVIAPDLPAINPDTDILEIRVGHRPTMPDGNPLVGMWVMGKSGVLEPLSFDNGVDVGDNLVLLTNMGASGIGFTIGGGPAAETVGRINSLRTNGRR